MTAIKIKLGFILTLASPFLVIIPLASESGKKNPASVLVFVLLLVIAMTLLLLGGFLMYGDLAGVSELD